MVVLKREPHTDEQNRDDRVKTRRFLSVEDYFALERSTGERFDYVEGEVFHRTANWNNHALIAGNLLSICKQKFRGSANRVYSSDVSLRVSRRLYVHPDVAVSSNQHDLHDKRSIMYPSLIIEIVTAETEMDDRGKKFAWYRTCSCIHTYMLVSAEHKEITVFTRETERIWHMRTYGPGDEVVELTELGIKFGLSDVYEDTFSPEED
jgi:Uma2 family endonuclease